MMAYILLGLLGLSVVTGIGGYVKGTMDTSAKCQTAALEAKIKTMQRDLDVANAAVAREAAENTTLETNLSTREQEIAAYERELAEEKAKEPEVIVLPGKPAPSPACGYLLNERDARRVSGPR